MRSTVARPASCTVRRRDPGSSGAGSARSAVSSAASNSSRSSTIARDSSSLRRNSSARGSCTATAGSRRRRRKPNNANAPSSEAQGRGTAAMLHWPPLPASPSRRFPELRSPARPIQTRGREVSGNVVAYEILLMLDAELPEKRQEEIGKRAQELVKKAGGKWVGHDVWGRRRLAYEIGHKGEGTYHLLNFDADAETLDELSRVLRITDGVMRHLAVRRIEGSPPGPPPPEPEPAAQSVPEPTYAETNIRSEEE